MKKPSKHRVDRPELRPALMEVLDIQLRDHDPPETGQTLERLLESGIDCEEARRLIACVIAAEIVAVMKTGRGFDRERFVARLYNLPAMPWDDEEDEQEEHGRR